MAKFIALVPAAGWGVRMGGELPKQYLPLAGQPMIYHALATLCGNPEITMVIVVLAPDDSHFAGYDWNDLGAGFGSKLEPLYCGGVTRAESVMNGLIVAELEPDDWVLVHDAARPCLSGEQLSRLIAEVRDDKIGGLLAVPVADTLKRADDADRVESTERREGLWQAQTPQMFRAGLLLKALGAKSDVTDDASAIEALGLRPKLVMSESTNFKVTYPEDIKLAEWLLAQKNRTPVRKKSEGTA